MRDRVELGETGEEGSIRNADRIVEEIGCEEWPGCQVSQRTIARNRYSWGCLFVCVQIVVTTEYFSLIILCGYWCEMPAKEGSLLCLGLRSG
jgi:hypothetical protein